MIELVLAIALGCLYLALRRSIRLQRRAALTAGRLLVESEVVDIAREYESGGSGTIDDPYGGIHVFSVDELVAFANAVRRANVKAQEAQR